jgi:hypothetical protein
MERIEKLDGIKAIRTNVRHIGGVDRELKYFGNKEDQYIKILLANIQKSNLTEPLRTQMLS